MGCRDANSLNLRMPSANIMRAKTKDYLFELNPRPGDLCIAHTFDGDYYFVFIDNMMPSWLTTAHVYWIGTCMLALISANTFCSIVNRFDETL